MAKDTKSAVQEARIRKALLKLHHNSDETQRKRDKRVNRFNSFILCSYIVVIILCAFTGAWMSALLMVTYILWLVLCWMKELQINELKYIIDMQHGIKEIEEQELKTQQEEASASTNAKRSRKK